MMLDDPSSSTPGLTEGSDWSLSIMGDEDVALGMGPVLVCGVDDKFAPLLLDLGLQESQSQLERLSRRSDAMCTANTLVERNLCFGWP
jgi:hypothetical protein